MPLERKPMSESSNSPALSTTNSSSETAPSTPQRDAPEQPCSNGPQRTRQGLESTCRNVVKELNTGKISLTNPVILSSFDPNFQATIHPCKLNLEEYISHLAYISEARPEYHLEITKMHTIVDEAKGTARVFMDFEISGVFQGVTKASVAVLRFRETGGHWRLTKYEAADGMKGGYEIW